MCFMNGSFFLSLRESKTIWYVKLNRSNFIFGTPVRELNRILKTGISPRCLVDGNHFIQPQKKEGIRRFKSPLSDTDCCLIRRSQSYKVSMFFIKYFENAFRAAESFVPFTQFQLLHIWQLSGPEFEDKHFPKLDLGNSRRHAT